jgi:hypothetical protein
MAEPRSNESFATVQARHVQHCTREAKLVALIWVLGLLYCTAVIVTWGYLPPKQRPDEPSLTFGIPSWVFWGLFLPWFVQIGVTWWFALRVLVDDEPFMEMPQPLTTRGEGRKSSLTPSPSPTRGEGSKR